MWVGTVDPLDAPIRAYSAPRISPDGRRLLVQIDGGLWMYDLVTRALTPLLIGTAAENLNPDAQWTRDGRSVIFSVRNTISKRSIDESHRVETLAASEYGLIPLSSSPNRGPSTATDVRLLLAQEQPVSSVDPDEHLTGCAAESRIPVAIA